MPVQNEEFTTQHILSLCYVTIFQV